MTSPPPFKPLSTVSVKSIFIGKSLLDIQTPAAVINVAAVRRNCERMLGACKDLNLQWRAHVKTHKTVEITRLQVGDDPERPVHLVVSTLAEASFMLPMLKNYRKEGRKVNVLYGLPVAPSAVPRLADIASSLGEDSISVLVDHPDQLPHLKLITSTINIKPHVYIKVDMGGRRAGVRVDSSSFTSLVDAALTSHQDGITVLKGLYSHAGHSYYNKNEAEALAMLNGEISAVSLGAQNIARAAETRGLELNLTLSVGASPTAMSMQNVTQDSSGDTRPEAVTSMMAEQRDIFQKSLEQIKESKHTLEIHAGVFPLLDLQQLSIHSLSLTQLSWSDLAFTILAEVHSIYPQRGVDETDEVLIGAGCLALGREPCKAYDGMAMLTPWRRPGAKKGELMKLPEKRIEECEGWVVGRFSQEHGILTWGKGKEVDATDSARATREDEKAGDAKAAGLEIGEKVKLWPNHACITSSHFGWYFVVDEDRKGKEDEVVDIWVRSRGW